MIYDVCTGIKAGIQLGTMDSNIYIVESDGYEDIFIIDTGLGHLPGVPAISKAKELLQQVLTGNPGKNIHVVLTHAHLDHIGGLATYPELMNSIKDVIIYETELEVIRDNISSYIDPIFGMKVPSITSPLKKVVDGDVIEMAGFEMEVIHTPGHTRGSMSLYDRKSQVLIAGDTVFPGGSVGRTDFPSGSMMELIDSVEKLSKLDIDLLLPGHMEPTRDGTRQVKMSLFNIKSWI
ncbi:MAG: MBL fold metallo-hydrolase [Candidatus Hodarchaeales archaeon]